MHQGHGTFDALIDQVGVKRGDLRCREHPLVDEGSCAQRRHVDALVRLGDATHGLVGCSGACVDGNLTLDALAGDERQAVQINAGGAVVGRHEDLPEDRHRHERRRSEDRFVDGHLTPPQHLQAFSLENALDFSGRCIRHARLLREKRHASGVCARFGQIEGHDVAEEAIGNLDQDAGAVAGVDVGAACTAVLEIAERADRLGDDLVALAAVHVAHEVEPTRVVLVPGVVQPLSRRQVAIGLVDVQHRCPSGRPGAVARWLRSRDIVGRASRCGKLPVRRTWANSVADHGRMERCEHPIRLSPPPFVPISIRHRRPTTLSRRSGPISK